MNNQIVTVNLIPGLSAPAVVKVSQYDVGRPITFNILDGASAASISSSMTVTVVGTKPSGLGFSQSAVIASLSTVTINTTLAMTQECGMIQAEIRFTQSGENVGTANFILAVEKTPHAEGTTDGTQETMADLETRLQAEIDDLSDRIDDIEAGGSGLSSTEKQLILTLFCKAAYAEDDAGVVYDALEALWTITTRTITYNLSHVSSSNITASIEQGQSYTTILTASTDYTLNTVTVTMGGVDITSTSYSSGTVSIPSVTGNIVITATAVSQAGRTFLYHFNDPIASSGNTDMGMTATTTNYVTGYFDKAYNVASADNILYATGIGSDNLPVLDGDFTIACWFKAGTNAVCTVYRMAEYQSTSTTTNLLNTNTPTFHNGYNWQASATRTGTQQRKYVGYSLSLTKPSGATGLVPFFTIYRNNEGQTERCTVDPYNANYIINYNEWHHYALTRKNGTVMFFIDGRKAVSFDWDVDLYVPNVANIGAAWSDATTPSAQSGASPILDELYIHDSACLYDSDFTPPSEPYSV